MLLVVLPDDLIVLLVGWEVMGICSYLLIGHHWERAEAQAAAVKAFVVTRLGDVGLLARNDRPGRLDGLLQHLRAHRRPPPRRLR